MSVVKDICYFSIQAWMVTKLKLKTVERDCYAIIFGYSQDGESFYTKRYNVKDVKVIKDVENKKVDEEEIEHKKELEELEKLEEEDKKNRE